MSRVRCTGRPPETVAHALIDAAGYAERYRRRRLRTPRGSGGRLRGCGWTGSKPYRTVKNTSFAYPGRVDQVVRGWQAQHSRRTASTGTWKSRGDQTAIIWESDDPGVAEHITYRQLHAGGVAKFANVLKSLGVGKGDRVVPLPADDPELRPMRCSPAPGSARSTRSSSPGSRRTRSGSRIEDYRREARRHRRRGAARRGGGAPLKASADKALEGLRGACGSLSGASAPAATSPWDASRDVWLGRGDGDGHRPSARRRR